MNTPVPDPSLVLESEISGTVFVLLQQTPLAVTGTPPSDVIFPPEIAVVCVIPVTVEVVSSGPANWLVVKVT